MRSLDLIECPAGTELQQKEFGRLVGMPKSTVNDWYHGKLARQIKYFLCALERIPEASRTALFREFCRECPRLDHPRLAHDPQTVDILRQSVVRPSGLTFVRGEGDGARTFLMTAIGNSAARLRRDSGVTGFDVHQPDSFVPVSGVMYFASATKESQAAEIIRENWWQVEKSEARLVLLNRVWALVPDLKDRIVSLARRRRVFVADQPPADIVRAVRNQRVKVDVVTVTTDSKGRIHISPKAAGARG